MNRKYFSLFFIILAVLLILTGCGSSTDQVSEDIENSQSGNVVISIKRPSTESASTDGEVKSLAILPESTNVRLRIFNDLRNITHDIVIPDTGVSNEEIKLPVGTYTIEAIAYGEWNRAQTIGKATGVIVENSVSTSVNIVLERPTYSMNAYIYDDAGNKVDITELEAGNEFSVDFSIDLNGFNKKYFHIYTHKEGEIPDSYDGLTTENSITLSSPLVETNTTYIIYAKAILDEKDYGSNFSIYFPNSAFLGDTPYQITLTPPEGGINIGIE